MALLGGVALLEEVFHCGNGLWNRLPSFQEANVLLFSFRWRCRTLSSSNPHLPGCCHVPILWTTDWTCEPWSQAQWNIVFIRIDLVMLSVHSSVTLMKTELTRKIRWSWILCMMLSFGLSPLPSFFEWAYWCQGVDVIVWICLAHRNLALVGHEALVRKVWFCYRKCVIMEVGLWGFRKFTSLASLIQTILLTVCGGVS